MSITDHSSKSLELPKEVTDLFWDVDPQTVSWEQHRDWIVGRVLSAGPWSTVVWLRKQIGDEALREWILRREGRGLDARQLRFWQVIFDIPESLVDGWLSTDAQRLWNGRVLP